MEPIIDRLIKYDRRHITTYHVNIMIANGILITVDLPDPITPDCIDWLTVYYDRYLTDTELFHLCMWCDSEGLEHFTLEYNPLYKTRYKIPSLDEIKTKIKYDKLKAEYVVRSNKYFEETGEVLKEVILPNYQCNGDKDALPSSGIKIRRCLLINRPDTHMCVKLNETYYEFYVYS